MTNVTRVAFIAALLAACVAPSPAATPAPATAPAATPAAAPSPIRTGAAAAGVELPIVDVHFHIDPRWDATALARVLEETGVTRAGNGGFGPDDLVLALARAVLGGRVVPFAGLSPIRTATQRHGERAWTLQDLDIASYMNSLERTLQAGAHKGMGELFVNNMNSHPANVVGTRYPADSPLMRRLWELSARYRVPLSVHMEADAASVAEMERLIASDRGGIWLWAHCGFTGAERIGPLLEKHPNLYCDLAFREEARRPDVPIDRGGKWLPEWRELVERLPDRFMLGTDTHSTEPGIYAQSIAYWRNLLAQLSPRTRELVAHENAERLLKLSPAR